LARLISNGGLLNLMLNSHQQPERNQRNDGAGTTVTNQGQSKTLGRQETYVDAHIDERLQPDRQRETGTD
jgi:hypothetical protein